MQEQIEELRAALINEVENMTEYCKKAISLSANELKIDVQIFCHQTMTFSFLFGDKGFFRREMSFNRFYCKRLGNLSDVESNKSAVVILKELLSTRLGDMNLKGFSIHIEEPQTIISVRGNSSDITYFGTHNLRIFFEK